MKNNLEEIKNKIQQAFGKYTFIENGHYYLCNGKRVGISTTGLIGQYEQEFDKDTISQMVANKRGISQQEVLEEWRIENLHSTIKGSFIHEFAQSLWEGKEYKFDYSNVPSEIDLDRLKNDIEKLIPQAINFYNDYKDMYELIGCEIYLGDEDFDECGATDQMMLNKYTGGITIIDYKTNKKIEYESYKHKKMLIPLHKFDDCNHVHYSFQLGDYKFKFEKNTKLKVEETFIVYFNVNADNYEIIEPLNMEKEVEEILENRRIKNMQSIAVLLISAIKGTKKRALIIDDSGYLMSFENFDKANIKSYDKFTTMAQNYYKLIEAARDLDNEKICYIVMHEEVDEDGKLKPKAIGKMLNQQLCIEGLFTIVLRYKYENGQYLIQTKTDGSSVVKSPIDLFEENEVPNDLYEIDKKIRDYYGFKPLEEKLDKIEEKETE